MAIRSYVRYINSMSLLEDLASGSVCVVVGWSDDAVRARRRSGEAGLDTDIRYVIPEEGTLSWFDALAIPKDASHPAEAHAIIDSMLRADIGAESTISVRCPTFDRAALPLIDADGQPIAASTSRRISMNAVAAGDGVRLARRMMP